MIIGIGGVSNSGKSSLAKNLKQSLKGFRVEIIGQDDYVFPENKIPKIKGHTDWEIPASINFPAFKKVLLHKSKTADVTIAEGLMVFYDEELRKSFDLSIFLEMSKKEFLKRKVKDLRWGLEPTWYIEYIWNSFLCYGQLPGNINAHRFKVENAKTFEDQLLKLICSKLK